MKTFLFSISLCVLILGCASTKQGKYKEDPNTKFAASRDFTQPPEQVMKAVKALADDISDETLPPDSSEHTTDAMVRKESDDNIEFGWVVSTSRDKYIEYKHNGEPRRAPLKVRRWYSISVAPALQGSTVDVMIKEEIQQRDLKTGVAKGWKNVAPHHGTIDSVLRRLTEKLRAL